MPDDPQDHLTLEEHLELGREVKRCASRLREISNLVVEVYGQGSRPGVSFLRTMDALERLDRDLQQQAAAELGHPIDDDFYL
jgi:hypothetical protein